MVTYKKVSRRKMWMKKLRHKYRLVFFNDNTFEEVWHLRLSLFNVLAAVGAISLFLVILVIVLMSFTSLREFIPGYPNEDMRKNIMHNAMLLDSLERKLQIRDQYFENLKALIAGDTLVAFDTTSPEGRNYKNIKFTKSIQDSLFRQQIEQQEKFNFSITGTPHSENNISEMHFFSPVKGLVTSEFNSAENHLGVDIVGSPNEVVKSTLDGTVIMASWTIETGNVIQIQHDHNIVSIYKHNANILKKVGTHVKAGEPIAIMGNSGELSTGPHLHFELWHNGKPVNPQDYIVFN
jgi:murein DD-endopeptidase MepM/ murein hydrolase activator NlpD